MEVNFMENRIKTVVITGGTSGIGFAVAKTMIEAGYRVIVVGSNQKRTDAAMNELRVSYPNSLIKSFFGDLSNQSAVHHLADEVGGYLKSDCGGRLDVLINNAGGVRDWYTTTEEGYEFQFALNHLAGFLLSHRLLPFLGNGVILFTGSYSHMHAKIHWVDPMYQKRYFIFSAYKQSKLCNIMTAKQFNEILKPYDIRSYVVDPGLVKTDIANKHTSWLVRLVWSIRKKTGVGPEVPARTYKYLCEQRPVEGLYFKDETAIPYNKEVDKPDQVKRLFEYSENLCGIHFLESLK